MQCMNTGPKKEQVIYLFIYCFRVEYLFLHNEMLNVLPHSLARVYKWSEIDHKIQIVLKIYFRIFFLFLGLASSMKSEGSILLFLYLS